MLHFASPAASPSSPAQFACAGSMKLFCTNTEGPYTCGENTSRSFGMLGGLAPASNRLPPQFGTVMAVPYGRWSTVAGVPSWLPAEAELPSTKISVFGFTELIAAYACSDI